MEALVIDASGRPIHYLSQRHAIKNVLMGKATIEAVYEDRVYRSGGVEVPVPKVISLKICVPLPRKLTHEVSNKLLFIRDRHTCQYCGKHARELKGKKNILEREHVIPICQHQGETYAERFAKANRWDNVTTACSKCNRQKGDCTPAQAGMTLLSQPYKPKSLVLHLVDKADAEQYEYLKDWLSLK